MKPIHTLQPYLFRKRINEYIKDNIHEQGK